jgi:hypothetical protein
MTKASPPRDTAKSAPDPRAERLKAALKANIAKRKDQARGRTAPQNSKPDNRRDQEE